MRPLRRRSILLAVVALLGTVAAALGVTTYRAERAAERRVDDLMAAAGSDPSTDRTGRGDPEELGALPDPVRRYLDRVLPPEQRDVRAARLEQRGDIELDGTWRPFTATQHVTVDPPGFVWDATVGMAPLVDARVVDASVDGEGSLRATVFGLPVAEAAPGPGLDSGELVRYLAEAVWFPTALRPSAGVEWESVDDRTARATLTHSETTATVTFHFGSDGLVERVSAERYRQEMGDYAPWVGRFDRYVRRDGLLVPAEGEVAWETADGEAPYWRGTVAAVDYATGRARRLETH